ncbi:hypothetical protein T07_15025 [Trichinella nelsoni]|uniref:Uncharacterized protein n=1 Tax=Trichinella nelsoni TaxID=6336 RepID=A0A0V0SCS4_9BILA|nr:hypothetical protein T07_15025 [Trichinella nelsoni]
MKLHLIVRKSLDPVELYNDAIEKSKIQYNKGTEFRSRCGLMDKAPASGAGDCGFESRHR